MREILFRAKTINIDGLKWEEGWVDFSDENRPCFWIKDNTGFNNKEFEPETLGQQWQLSEGVYGFTGDLFKAICAPSGKDKSKKKEYICKIIDSGRGCEIAIWYNKVWWAYGYFDFSSMKHIGNIHDNQELLK